MNRSVSWKKENRLLMEKDEEIRKLESAGCRIRRKIIKN
mgnify:CR=1 FL=1